VPLLRQVYQSNKGSNGWQFQLSACFHICGVFLGSVSSFRRNATQGAAALSLKDRVCFSSTPHLPPVNGDIVNPVGGFISGIEFLAVTFIVGMLLFALLPYLLEVIETRMTEPNRVVNLGVLSGDGAQRLIRKAVHHGGKLWVIAIACTAGGRVFGDVHW
jgi:hypothetical protein